MPAPLVGEDFRFHPHRDAAADHGSASRRSRRQTREPRRRQSDDTGPLGIICAAAAASRWRSPMRSSSAAARS